MGVVITDIAPSYCPLPEDHRGQGGSGSHVVRSQSRQPSSQRLIRACGLSVPPIQAPRPQRVSTFTELHTQACPLTHS